MRNKLIKRQYLLLFIGISLFLLFLLGSWTLYSLFYPLARPIHLPGVQDVTSVTVTKLDGAITESTDRETIEIIMLTLETAKPTRLWTVNDHPDAPNYGGVELHWGESSTTVFYYRERGVWYAEQPYQGIYEISDPEWEEMP